ncbi:Hypothetical protein AT6N2_L1825 [Agrobacterium tumefaciens]|nr:Hypothetical protein AT6N2_L1825 [Agrobacterium tumefaciens]
MVGRLITPSLCVQDLGKFHARLVIIGILREITFERDRIANFTSLLILRYLFRNELNGGIIIEFGGKRGKQLARPLILPGGDHAFGDTGNRCGVFRVGLHDCTEYLCGAIEITIGEELLRLGQSRLDFSLRITRIRTGELVDKLLDLAFRYGTHEAIYRPTIDKSNDRGNGLNTELAGNGRMIVNVQLHKLHTTVSLIDHLFEGRRQLLARSTPGRPEIHQNRLAARFFHDVLGKPSRRGILNVAGGSAVQFAILMDTRGHLPAIRTAVRIIVAAHAGLPKTLSSVLLEAKIVSHSLTFKTSGVCPVASRKRMRSFDAIVVVWSLERGWPLTNSFFSRSLSSTKVTCPPLSFIAPKTVTDPGTTPRYSSIFSGRPKETRLAAPMTL